jgi:hypothetical protein
MDTLEAWARTRESLLALMKRPRGCQARSEGRRTRNRSDEANNCTGEETGKQSQCAAVKAQLRRQATEKTSECDELSQTEVPVQKKKENRVSRSTATYGGLLRRTHSALQARPNMLCNLRDRG